MSNPMWASLAWLPAAVAPPNQALQLVGAALILGAFLLLQLRIAAPDRPNYLALNLAGAGLLAYEAARTGQIGFLVLEGVWALISAAALVRVLIKKRGSGRTSPRE
jgi:hypothetical protein